MRDPEGGYWLVLVKAACQSAGCMFDWRCCLVVWRCWLGASAAQASEQQGRGDCLGIAWRFLLGGLGGREAAWLPARCRSAGYMSDWRCCLE